MLTEHLLTLRDILPSGTTTHEFVLPFDRRRVQVRDIIVERVRLEHDARRDAGPGLAPPPCPASAAERALSDRPEPRDIERAVAAALKGFDDNAYFVIVDDRQVESLDQWLDVGLDPVVRFLRLVPIAGG